MRLRDLGEFGLIERIERIAVRTAPRGGPGAVLLGIGDDAALLRLRPREQLAVSTDALVEGVHFRFTTQAPRTVGRRALLVALSDLSAMGARPLGVTVALAAPPDLDVRTALDLARGCADVGARAACPLVGGNVTRARVTSLTLTVLGGVPSARALLRRTARPGDRLFVTGRVGAAALARARAERGPGRLRQLPPLRLAAGRALGRLAARGACIDVSDGLVADLRHVLEASRVGAELDTRRLPVAHGFGPACARLGLDPVRTALTGGEDYELLFTIRPGGPGAATLARRLGAPVTELGRIIRGRALRILGPGGRVLAGTGGHRHF